MSHRISLAPVDLVFSGKEGYSVEFLLRFHYPLDESRLRLALRRVVARFFPIGGRLVSGKMGYDVEQSANALDFKVLPSIAQLDSRAPADLAQFNQPIHSLPGEPLIRIRYAAVASGSALNINISHCLADGYSFFFFVSSVAAFYRARGFTPVQWIRNSLIRPDLDRSKLFQPPTDLSQSMHTREVNEEDCFQRTGLAFANPREFPALKNCSWDFIEISETRFQELLAEAAASSRLRLSRHDVLAAWLWKTVSERWPIDGDLVSCSSAFDYRRVHPDLSPRYFGNAIRGAAVRMPRDHLLERPLGGIAEKIRESTSSINEETVRDSLVCIDEIRRLHGVDVFSRFHVSHPKNGLLVTNLSRIPRNHLDFGQGPPQEIVPLTSAPRVAVVLPTSDGVVVRLQG